MKKPTLRHIPLAGILAITLGAAAPAAAQTAQTPQHLNIGISQYPSTLHPLFDAMVAKSVILGAAQRPMTAHNAAWSGQCMICTELPSFENGLAVRENYTEGKTGIAATYKIRPGLAWDDGTPLTAADFIFAWQVGKHPQSGV
ncbi:MAG TPA: peptide ABC transporter substrate-binding protein, partial [Alphaproteobacteria bacterium]|nr:peptide ABC transporter substrate-binding protein [Alphaproteobacteria bacterium]